MLLQGKKLLITGVLTPQSIAYGIAERALEQGAEIILTGFGRARSLTERSAKRLKAGTEVLELDVTNPAHFTALTESLRQRWGRVDGALHGVAYAPEDALGGNFLNTPWESVQTAFRVSTFSLKELAVAAMPLMPR
ncbi:MAG TPA: SDR family oxidoreductase, partial [Aggregicoccus sp.]|nr:SDR family oxidoreductase [Aggregicoccus sp.]